MSVNLELKAVVSSLSRAASAARRLGARRAGTFRQKDTFLRLGHPRLKVREQEGQRAELIYYERRDGASLSGRWSGYLRVPVRDTRWIRGAGDAGDRGLVIVRKTRSLFLYRNARIHLDTVRGLGSFIEFEVVLERSRRQAAHLLDTLVSAFGIRPEDIVAGAYADLVQERLQR